MRICRLVLMERELIARLAHHGSDRLDDSPSLHRLDRQERVGAVAYADEAIIRSVLKRLAARPFDDLKRVAGELGVDRHTIARALKRQSRMAFVDLQRDCVFASLDRLSTDDRPVSRKQAAALFECSSRTVTRWVRRWELDRGRKWPSTSLAPE